MKIEEQLYNKFVQNLITKLESQEVSHQELSVIQKFIQAQGLGADPNKHEELKKLEHNLPFEDYDELPPLRLIETKNG